MHSDTIILVGGRDDEARTTGEILKSKLSNYNLRGRVGAVLKITGGATFDLQNGGFGTCAIAIADQNVFLMIGGQSDSSWQGSPHRKVDRYKVFNQSSISHLLFFPSYDSQGKFLGSLPDIDTPRMDHACATFVSSQGEQVPPYHLRSEMDP